MKKKRLFKKRAHKKFEIKNTSIKIKLILMPLILVLIGVTAITAISSVLTKNSLLNEMKHNGFQQSEEFLKRMDENNTSLEIINNMLDERIRAAGNIIKINDSNINSTLLSQYARELGVDELNYYNTQGEIIYSTNSEYIGKVAEEGSGPYIFLSNSLALYMEGIRQNTITGEYYKYGYINIGVNGFIQVGILADRINELTDAFNSQSLIDEIASNDDIVYASLVNRDMEAIAHSNHEQIGLTLDDPSISLATTDKIAHAVETHYSPESIDVYSVSVPSYIDDIHVGTINIAYSMEEIQNTIRKHTLMSLGSGIIIFLLLAFALYIISNNVVSIINRLKEQVAFMAKGDFSKDIPEDLTKQNNEFGEISRAISTMQDSMKDIISNILEASQQLAASSEELTATSQQSATAANEVAKVMEDISHGASDQAIETEKGHISISQLGDLLMENEDFIENLNSTSEKIDQLKDEGLRTLEELRKQTNLSSQSASEVQKVIENTNESARKIESASQMIQSIADQTNLLALNATIEAARAGEAGQGFAVVANEIKQLADQSSQFTEEINTIIGDLNEKTSQAVKAMQIGAETFAIQAGHVDTTSNQFYGIAETIDEIKEATKQVNESSKHMTNQKEIILSIMEELSAISQENAAGSQEASASVEEQTASTEEIANSSNDLAKLAEELNQRMNQFTVI